MEDRCKMVCIAKKMVQLQLKKYEKREEMNQKSCWGPYLKIAKDP